MTDSARCMIMRKMGRTQKNIREYWWRSMVYLHQNIVGIDAAILYTPPPGKLLDTWMLSMTPLIDNKDSKNDTAPTYWLKIMRRSWNKSTKEIEKAKSALAIPLTNNNLLPPMSGCCDTGKKNKPFWIAWPSPWKPKIWPTSSTDRGTGHCRSDTGSKTGRMYGNSIWCSEPSWGLLPESATDLYLRPETFGIFVNFLNVQKTGRMKIPFGIAQTGKAFRNEIVARQFIFRMQNLNRWRCNFFRSARRRNEMVWIQKETRLKWHLSMGMGSENYRFRSWKVSHYANAACDIEFNFPFGFKELEEIHSQNRFRSKSARTVFGTKTALLRSRA